MREYVVVWEDINDTLHHTYVIAKDKLTALATIKKTRKTYKRNVRVY